MVVHEVFFMLTDPPVRLALISIELPELKKKRAPSADAKLTANTWVSVVFQCVMVVSVTN